MDTEDNAVEMRIILFAVISLFGACIALETLKL